MSLARAVLVLLTCQVDAASIVRTHSLSVDAMGEVSGFHSDDANAAQNILAQVEELAQSRAAVDKPKIETIQELAKELEDALEETRKSAQQEVDRNLDAIVKCNTDQAASITKIAASTKVQVDLSRILVRTTITLNSFGGGGWSRELKFSGRVSECSGSSKMKLTEGQLVAK